MTYIERCTSRLNGEDLALALRLLRSDSYAALPGRALELIRARSATLTGNHSGPLNGTERAWQLRVQELVANIVGPNALEAVAGDHTREQVTTTALDNVKKRFADPLLSITSDHRIALARHVSALIIHLAHGTVTTCAGACPRLAVPTLPALYTVISCLFNADAEVTPTTRLEAYRALDTIIKHDRLQWQDDYVVYLTNLVEQGMLDCSRSVRLLSG